MPQFIIFFEISVPAFGKVECQFYLENEDDSKIILQTLLL